jgi:hypothetical protein
MCYFEVYRKTEAKDSEVEQIPLEEVVPEAE